MPSTEHHRVIEAQHIATIMGATGDDSTGTTEEAKRLLPQQSIMSGMARGLREKRDEPRILTRIFNNLKDLKIKIHEEHSAEILLGIVLALKRFPRNSRLTEQACQAICNLGRYKSCRDAIVKYGIIEQLECCADNIAGDVALSTKLLTLFRDYWDPIEQKLEAIFRFTTVLMERNRCCEMIQVLGIETFTKCHIIWKEGGDSFLSAPSRQAVFVAMCEFGSKTSILENGCEVLCSDIVWHECSPKILEEFVKMELFTLPASNKTCRLCSMIPSLLGRARNMECVDAHLLILKYYPHLEFACCLAMINLRIIGTANTECFLGLAQDTGIITWIVAALARNPQSMPLRLGVCFLMEKFTSFMQEDAADTDSTKVLVNTVVTVISDGLFPHKACDIMCTLALHLRGVKSLLLGHAKQIISAASDLFENSELADVEPAKTATEILCQLDLRVSVVQQRLLDAQIIMHVCGAMKRFPTDPVVHRYGCKILRCFVRSRHCAHRDSGFFILSRCGAKDAAKISMANHPSDKRIVYIGAEIVLRIRDFEREMHRFSNSFSGID